MTQRLHVSAQVKVRRHRERDTLLHEQEEINVIKAQSLKMEARSIFCADFGGTNRFYRMELKIVKYMTFVVSYRVVKINVKIP